MPDVTPNLGLKKPLGNETVSRATYNENLDILDQNAVKRDSSIAELTGGLLADRPEPGVAGRYYFAQDVGAIYLDTGTEWVLAAASQGDITGLQQQVTSHLSENMPHQFIDGVKTYKWGLSVVNGVVMFNYEEVI